MIVSVFDPLAVLLLIAANWQQKREKEGEDVYIDEGELPDAPEELLYPVVEPISNPVSWTTTTTEYVEPEMESTEVKLEDDLHASDDTKVTIKGDDHIVEKTVVNYEPIEESEEDELDIKVVEEGKDWEPNLYDRVQKRDDSLPQKTQSFLNKAKEVFSLQEPKS